MFTLHAGMPQLYGPSKLAIYAYGSLLSDPGEKIAQHFFRLIARIRARRRNS